MGYVLQALDSRNAGCHCHPFPCLCCHSSGFSASLKCLCGVSGLHIAPSFGVGKQSFIIRFLCPKYFITFSCYILQKVYAKCGNQGPLQPILLFPIFISWSPQYALYFSLHFCTCSKHTYDFRLLLLCLLLNLSPIKQLFTSL